MSYDFNSETERSAAAKFAIECRKIRVWIANNPGSTTIEIRKGTKVADVASHLAKMIVMGLIREETQTEGRFTKEVFFVVPQ